MSDLPHDSSPATETRRMCQLLTLVRAELQNTIHHSRAEIASTMQALRLANERIRMSPAQGPKDATDQEHPIEESRRLLAERPLPTCPKCGAPNRASSAQRLRLLIYICQTCRTQFTVDTRRGTL